MKSMLKYLLPLAIFLGLAGFLAVGLKLDPREVPSPLIGKPTPAFSLPRLGEAGAKFSADEMKGKVWLLNVWASWCVSCREEHPVLMELASDGKLELYGLDYKDTDAEALDVLKQMGNPYRAVAVDADGRVGIDYGVYGVPETYVIDKAGVIRYKHTGPVTREIWTEKFQPLLKGLQ
jgi:cytochrome c biogenesis protein CcmG, thiol:disulfide interchange protein DsbE